jgi:hypothetical protein
MSLGAVAHHVKLQGWEHVIVPEDRPQQCGGNIYYKSDPLVDLNQNSIFGSGSLPG